MSRIRIITASAGSGKTTRLTEILRDALVSKEARPEAVVATTFTNKAAAELQERARQQLLTAGRPADAHRLSAARIGTVNAVCGRLVEEFAFELGLPPGIQVIDEDVAAEALNRALSSIATFEIEEELAALRYRVEEFEWQSVVRRIVQQARTNGISSDKLQESAEQSVASLLTLFGAPAEDGGQLDRELADALRQFLDDYDKGNDSTVGTRKAADRCREDLRKLERGQSLPWREWATLAGLGVTKASKEIAGPVMAAAAAHDRHPELHADLCRAVTLTFQLARQALETYQQQKRQWGVVDFVDQEVYALELLKRPEIRERLAGEIDLVLVDEFQDTSPLQLAIFLELARIAPSSVWVGDQKQAIFGFRGTDPALMNAALEDLMAQPDPQLIDSTVEKILETTAPETLSKSWRSRPELVRLTSDVFARVFEAHGIPEERVRLEPGNDNEPAGLGAVVEHWPLMLQDKRKTTDLVKSVAAGVRNLLESETARVRDRSTGAPRAVAPGDVAVLCRTNADCDGLTRALESLGIRAEVPRTGLLSTPEALTALAGLALWIDPGSRLAAAELARIATYADRGDAWLAAVLEDDGYKLFDDVPQVRRLRQARQDAPDAGPLDALDRVVVALESRRLARAWGDDAARTANLDALRAHAFRYTSSMASQHLPATLPGLLRYLRELAEEGQQKHRRDRQALRSAGDAVVVSTWHRAKGLEWPVTVLFGLEKLRENDALGVQVVGDWNNFDIERPLRGRWVRYWQTPYKGIQKGTPFKERLEAHPENERAVKQGRREALRLLYVGWTRARDRLVLAANDGKLMAGPLKLLTAIDPALITPPTRTGEYDWAGRKVEIPVHPAAAQPPVERSLEPGSMVTPGGPRSHPPAVVVASQIEGRGSVGQPEVIGDRLPLSGDPEMSHLGMAVHGFLAADDVALAAAERRGMAEELLSSWGVADALRPEDLVAASDRLTAWLGKHWPGAETRREVPVLHRLDSGSLMRGVVDLIVTTDRGPVVIDHKSFPGDLATAMEMAAGFGGQLGAYSGALRSVQNKPCACFIHLPLLGRVVPIDLGR